MSETWTILRIQLTLANVGAVQHCMRLDQLGSIFHCASPGAMSLINLTQMPERIVEQAGSSDFVSRQISAACQKPLAPLCMVLASSATRSVEASQDVVSVLGAAAELSLAVELLPSLPPQAVSEAITAAIIAVTAALSARFESLVCADML